MIMDFTFKAGYIPDPKHIEYQQFSQNMFSSANTSTDIDLRKYSLSRHNQKKTSSCVCNASTKALEIKRVIEHGPEKHVSLSVLSLYWTCRERMVPRQTDKDEGTHIYIACQGLQEVGICRDELFPFDKNDVFTIPPIMASREGRINRIKNQFKISSTGKQRLDDIIFNLRAKNPVIFGTPVGASWFNYNENSAPIGFEQHPEGGHAMCCVGYVGGNFIVENSWGNSWGKNGFAEVLPEVFTDSDTTDLWVIVNGSEDWEEK